jgi:hypothetical protein
MRNSQHLVSLKTYGLAFALVLSPMLLQTEGTCAVGDTRLTMLEFDVAGQNLIVFDPQEQMFDVLVPESVETATIRALAEDTNAALTYVSDFGEDVPATVANGLGIGGGEVLVNLPPGDGMLIILVKCENGATAGYVIHVIRGSTCP